MCSVVVNFSLKRSVVLPNTLHGFREGMRAGISTLEAKLANQLAGLVSEILFQVFLDVHTAYGLLDMEQ